MQPSQDFSIRYADEGLIRSGDDLICLVYLDEQGRYFYFYGVSVQAKTRKSVRREIKIPDYLHTIEDPAARCQVLKRVRDFAAGCEGFRGTSTAALDAEILALERAA